MLLLVIATENEVAQIYEKLFYFIEHWGDASQIHSEKSPHSS
jgi:hypothetical protein